jgi:hypothetical protein
MRWQSGPWWTPLLPRCPRVGLRAPDGMRRWRQHCGRCVRAWRSSWAARRC